MTFGIMPAAATTPRQKAIANTELTTAIFEAFVEAVEPLIRDHLARGLRDHGAIASALNRRGIPCWGRDRWCATDIRMVLSHAGSGPDAAGATPPRG
ncbi:MAG: hypothetical protein JNK84_09025 [Phreatobacter sp.]|uniref:hypothetical protein n=1 Tax=Phreatobacter sp. TaxID=1966341 RepID=UPI001A3A45CC|nr:hypothetical protein [Phreatobacter sp.]MBL8569215.1 hypothetical protein [Phreatobacter sp.]